MYFELYQDPGVYLKLFMCSCHLFSNTHISSYCPQSSSKVYIYLRQCHICPIHTYRKISSLPETKIRSSWTIQNKRRKGRDHLKGNLSMNYQVKLFLKSSAITQRNLAWWWQWHLIYSRLCGTRSNFLGRHLYERLNGKLLSGENQLKRNTSGL